MTLEKLSKRSASITIISLALIFMLKIQSILNTATSHRLMGLNPYKPNISLEQRFPKWVPWNPGVPLNNLKGSMSR